MAAQDFPTPQDAEPPLITPNVAAIFAGFGLVATMGMGWMLARSTAGLSPLTLGGRAAQTTAAGADASSLKVIASDLKYDAKELHLPGPGEVKVQFRNDGLIDHDITVDSARFKLFARPGQGAAATLKVDKPGTYTYYCSLPGHREAGITGTLVVDEGDGALAKTGARGKGVAPATGTAATGKAQQATGAGTASHASHAITVSTQSQGNQPLPYTLDGATKTFSLTARAVRREVLPGVFEEAWVYNDQLPGPVMRVTSAVQEPKGLYGVLIIDPKPGSPEAARHAQYARDYIQVVSEFGGYFTINGKAFPATEVLEAKQGEKVRLRVINLGQALHPMHLHGYHFKIVGTDGYMVEGPPLTKDTVTVGPVERYDLEFVADNPGTWVFHCHILSHVGNQGVEPGGMISLLKVT